MSTSMLLLLDSHAFSLSLSLDGRPESYEEQLLVDSFGMRLGHCQRNQRSPEPRLEGGLCTSFKLLLCGCLSKPLDDFDLDK